MAMQAETPTGPARVLVGLSMEPPVQGRWSVLFRLLLAIPLMIALLFVAVVAVIVLVISWFAALILGRVPDAFQEFLVGYHRLAINVEAYLYLLVPRWPGLQYSPSSSNQVTLEVDQVKLNRFAVLFRLFLAIPALIVYSLITGLAQVYVFIMWVAAIITKRTPTLLHQTMALILRFSTRVSAYYSLLTPTQPFAGFFGDAESSGPADQPTSWKVKPGVRVLLILSLIAGAIATVALNAGAGGPSQPTVY